MKRIKRWFLDRFLPMWAKETVLAENKALRRENEQLQKKLEEKDAYINGLMAGIKSQRRIIINTQEVKK